MRRFGFYILIFFSVAAAASALAQRRVTPVEPTNNITLAPNPKDKELEKDSIAADSLAADSAAKRMKYPRLQAVSIGVNVWDPLMRLCKQSYGGIDFSADISLWNRIFPTVEVGVGNANSTPDGMNFTYKTKFAPYAKIGVNYNFLYNKDAAYKAMVGFRLGYSNFTYDINDISMSSGYWDESSTTSITGQKSHATWGEFIFAIRVKMIGNISVGWAFKYHKLWKYKKNENSDPWYIPGYGARGSSVTAGLSLFYTLPLSKSKLKDAAKDAYTGQPLDAPKGSAPASTATPPPPDTMKVAPPQSR